MDLSDSIESPKSPIKRPLTPLRRGTLVKFREDRWGANPPQVTSYLTYSRPKDDHRQTRYSSPSCGFGWRFLLDETFHYQATGPNSRVQELVGQVDATFQPHKCSSRLGDVKINVKVSYPGSNAKLAHEEEFTNISVKSDSNIGTYVEPFQYKGGSVFEITLTFNTSDDLALPTTSSVNTRKALHHSLDGPSFVDTKFYLFSARAQGRAAIPKAVFARSQLLIDSGTYLQDLISPATGFANGTSCNLRRDDPEEIAKLNPDIYDYGSDSDLEEEPDGKGKEKASEPPDIQENEEMNGPVDQAKQDSADQVQNGRAFAINGTAYKTWKAFVFYTYTSIIRFNEFRSRGERGWSSYAKSPLDPDFISCSPKSMYRFADYADLPVLKSLAKEGIRKNLGVSNVITELFSVFTSKYQEVIELEVDFLVDNFSPGVARDLDNMLQLIVLGTKPHCFRVLAFTMRRLRGDNTRSAWNALTNGIPEPWLPPPTPVVPTTPPGHPFNRPSTSGIFSGDAAPLTMDSAVSGNGWNSLSPVKAKGGGAKKSRKL